MRSRGIIPEAPDLLTCCYLLMVNRGSGESRVVARVVVFSSRVQLLEGGGCEEEGQWERKGADRR